MITVPDTLEKKPLKQVDLTPYQPFQLGLPILLFLAGVGLTALLVVGLYEWLF